MSETLDALEARISALRGEIRRAVRARDGALARELRAELRGAERAWDRAVAGPEAADPAAGTTERAGEPASLLPVREQVHQALTLIGAPAAARMIVAVHAALHAGSLGGGRLASLRRDEERSFRGAPYARPYYLCAALTDRLSASRGLFAVSTWPLERRVVGPLSPRVDFLTTAVRVAEHVLRLAEAGEPAAPGAERLLARLARNVPGATGGPGRPGVPAAPDPRTVVKAAHAELRVHAAADAAARADIAGRARARLGDAERLFGGLPLGLAEASC
ncbi:hypothetical protein [Sphaerisporangium rufum]|uniref:hypothetical protein n=1 Tax=Sphaerisporangium rufum TaxID=1381558 RepID=UPI00194DCB13|nr:hypothetical protein [Sphaerisporangium rufum]